MHTRDTAYHGVSSRAIGHLTIDIETVWTRRRKQRSIFAPIEANSLKRLS